MDEEETDTGVYKEKNCVCLLPEATWLCTIIKKPRQTKYCFYLSLELKLWKDV